MDNYRIVNKVQLDEWINAQMQKGYDLTAVKNPCPTDALYSDGTLCTSLINVAWQCVQTGEVFAIEYEKEPTFAGLTHDRACELVNAAHSGLIVGRHNQAKEDEAEIEKLRDRIRELEESERKARLEAETLAMAMWRRWYKEDSPNFELCDSTAGIITQIDNMVAGMKREKEEPLRFADKRLLERALGSLSKGDVEDATKCIEVVLERSPDFN